jgi:hypothetical protein
VISGLMDDSMGKLYGLALRAGAVPAAADSGNGRGRR